MVLDASKKKAVEWIDEDTFDTFPTDPAMKNFGGYANPATITRTPNHEAVPYLKGADETNTLQATKQVKVSESYEAEIEIKPTDWSLLPYVLKSSDPATFEIGDEYYTVAMGIRAGDDYETLTGGVFSQFEFECEQDATATATLTAMFASSSGVSVTDYVGTGSHATAPSGDPLKWGDISGVSYDGGAPSNSGLNIESIGFTFGYEMVDPVKDADTGNTSNIAGWKFGQRNIQLNLGISLDDMDIVDDVLGGANHSFKFSALGKELTFSNIKWTDDFETEYTAEDYLGTEITASYCDISIV